MIKVGYIRTTHGIKGELKVESSNSIFRNNFDKPLYINTNPYTEVHIKKVSHQNDILLVSFKEFNDINEVLKFKGLDILVDKENLDPLEEDEYYIEDLIGLKVYNEDGQYRGDVKDVFELPQSFYLRVEKDGKEHLVPFIDEFIIDVSDQIIVKEIEGLFDEN